MKQRIRLFIKVILLVGVLAPGSLWGQADTARLEPRIGVSYFQDGDDLPYLTGRVRVKRDKGWEPVKWVIVNLFLNEETKLGMMGNITTDTKGGGKYILPEKFKAAWDSLDEYTFIARIKGDSQVEDGEESITIKRSRLEVTAETVDSVRMVTITLTQRDHGKWVPVPEVELKAFIDRQFGKLPLGEETYTTDDAGKVALEFNVQIPGDQDGNIRVGAWIEDHDDFGNRTALTTVAWGLPLHHADGFDKERTLWSTRDKAPVWLILLSNGMILIVWGVIFYLVYLIFKIKTENKSKSQTQDV